jgi:hypothetical protein
MEFTAEELAKLPKWAVSRIQTLQAKLAHVEQELNLATGGVVTNVYQQRGFDFKSDARTYLPDQEVVFMMDAKYRAITVRQGSPDMVKYYGPHISVMGCMASLLVAPEVANVVRISLTRI